MKDNRHSSVLATSNFKNDKSFTGCWPRLPTYTVACGETRVVMSQCNADTLTSEYRGRGKAISLDAPISTEEGGCHCSVTKASSDYKGYFINCELNDCGDLVTSLDRCQVTESMVLSCWKCRCR